MAPPASGSVPAGDPISWQGNAWFLQGANVLWFNWPGEFGSNAIGGVSTPDVTATLNVRFQQAQAGGLHTIR
jgi:hypothetical protein